MAALARPVVNVLLLNRFPIYNQLLLEEALLRGTTENWCLVNDGAFNPAIVMGISGKANELIQVPQAIQADMQVIKRFSGGGTVVVDEDTVFATLIMQAGALPDVAPFPQEIMKWTEGFYRPSFEAHGEFRLRENDYVFRESKVGGNAQAITGKRWLHHTSFLWDYRSDRMGLLKHPPKAPEYRQGRRHEDFVSRLCQIMGSREELVRSICMAPAAVGLDMRASSLGEAASALASKKQCGTKLVDLSTFLDPAPPHQQDP